MPPQTVLIVDSSPLTTRRVEEALAGLGWSIVLASNQSEIDLLLEREPIKVVVTSLVYPKGNGYDLCKQVKSLNSSAQVFLLCGPFEVYSKERARMVGVADRIQRPLVAEVFRRQLESLLGELSTQGASVAPAGPEGTLAAKEAEEKSEAESTRSEPRNEPGSDVRGDKAARTDETGGLAPREPGNSAPREPGNSAPREPGNSAGASAYGWDLRADAADALRPRPLSVAGAEERLATFLPRAYPRPGHEIPVSPELSAATERAIAQVLPEVLPELIEAVVSNALVSSPALRELVAATVEQVVREQVATIVSQVASQAVRQRLQELEQADP